MNKRGNSSPSNPSPNSFMRQSERKPSRTRSPRGTVLDHFTGIRLEAFEMCCDWWRTNRTNLLKRDSVVVDFSFTCAFTFKRIHRLTSILLFLLFVFEFPVSGCEAMIPPTNKDLQIFLRLCRGSGNKGYISKTKLRDDAPSALRQRRSLMFYFGNLLVVRVLHTLGKEVRHHCFHYGPDAISSTQGRSNLFLERLKLPFPIQEILSGFEESSLRAQTKSLLG